MKKILAISLAIIAVSYARGLFTNGDFEQDLTVGWTQAQSGANITFNRATNYDTDPDYEAYVYKGSGSGYAKLFQVVDIPSTDLIFTADAKIYAYDNNADTLCWAGAAVIISYLNASNSVLGETRICMRTAPCPWQNSSTLHLIPVSDSLWHNHSFNINDELANLPGVNPSNVVKIQIALFDTTDHTC
jgi:hypothetical protein